MNFKKISPSMVLSALGIIIIVVFLAISASGYKGLLPGSNLYKNKSDWGYYVFYRLLEELDYKVEFESIYTLPAGTGNSIVYLEMNDYEEDELDRLSNWVSKGNVLILSGESSDIFFNAETTDFSEITPFTFSEHSYNSSSHFKGTFLKKLQKKKVLAENGDGSVLLTIQMGKGSLLLIADISLFNNANLHEIENAFLLDNLLSPYNTGSIYLREKMSEAVFDPSLIKGIFKGKLSIITIHLLLVLICFLIVNGKRFSTPQNLLGIKRRKISEHIIATGLFYQRAGASYLIEKTDSEYFRTVICRNRKPSLLSEEDYNKYSTPSPELSEEEMIMKYKSRNTLIEKIRSRNNV